MSVFAKSLINTYNKSCFISIQQVVGLCYCMWETIVYTERKGKNEHKKGHGATDMIKSELWDA